MIWDGIQHTAEGGQRLNKGALQRGRQRVEAHGFVFQAGGAGSVLGPRLLRKATLAAHFSSWKSALRARRKGRVGCRSLGLGGDCGNRQIFHHVEVGISGQRMQLLLNIEAEFLPLLIVLHDVQELECKAGKGGYRQSGEARGVGGGTGRDEGDWGYPLKKRIRGGDGRLAEWVATTTKAGGKLENGGGRSGTRQRRLTPKRRRWGGNLKNVVQTQYSNRTVHTNLLLINKTATSNAFSPRSDGFGQLTPS